MIIFSNAKINIGLNIIEKRADGFHNLESIFYPIELSDVLEIIPSNENNYLSENKYVPEYVFTNTGIIIDSPEKDNLIIKALKLILEDYKIPNIKIHIHKNISLGAGLGGGSSNATYMLRLLNSYFKLNISDEKLTNYARQLGSDCAFFIKNKPVYATQKGDVFTNINFSLERYKIVVVRPKIHVSTIDAYKGIVPKKREKHLPDLIKLPITEWKNYIFNDFEETIFVKYPEIRKIKNDLYKKGALYASMSGSGGAVYGIFNKI